MKKLMTVLIAICSMGLMAAGINLNLLDNYSRQPTPGYIRRSGALNGGNLTDEGATLGRVLFYDKLLSANNTIACGSCHHQQFAFGDTAVQSRGLHGGLTTRHAMRLINTRFGNEQTFFWDERAAGLEAQTTQPIRNHVEMGFSGTNGDPGMDSLIRKLQTVSYYKVLFRLAFGDSLITEERIQMALAQFVRSIQSFDSKYDSGRALVSNELPPFPNFTAQENEGKNLFLQPPASGGAGCFSCHRAPVFDIAPSIGNNNNVGVAGQPDSIDVTVTRAPSLRDIAGPTGKLNAPLMHDGSIASLSALIDHYNVIVPNAANSNLSRELEGQNLNLTAAQKDALIAFLKTLTGSNVYTDPKWSDPFDANGQLQLTPAGISSQAAPLYAALYPNPAGSFVQISLPPGSYLLEVYDAAGRALSRGAIRSGASVDLRAYPAGWLLFRISDPAGGRSTQRSILKAGD